MQKVLLVILDGLGEAAKSQANAVALAQTPHLDFYRKNYPSVLLKTSGNAVGLPRGVMGASEPGHLTMGAGRVVWQPLEEINQAIKTGDFFTNKTLVDLMRRLKQNSQPLHLIGMVSDAGVHAHTRHLFALLTLAQQIGLKKVLIHCIADGRDVPERSVKKYLRQIEQKAQKLELGTLVSLIGRYYAMDRDQNYDRTALAYNLYTNSKGEKFENWTDALTKMYQTVATDYYLTPCLFPSFQAIQPQDGVIFFNFRSDRARQLTDAFLNPDFKHFSIKTTLKKFVAFGPYTELAPVAFPPMEVLNNCGSFLAQHHLKQLRIAETEKYAHVTFFFNSQVNAPYPGEERILVHSPKCASYAEKPEMAAPEVMQKTCAQIQRQYYDAVILNFANPDLVGHSGNLKATIKAVETVDECAGKVIETALKNHYQVILTADHGNAEQMLYPGTKIICPAHTTNPVRCYLIGAQFKKTKIKLRQNLGLSSLAPTMFKMMGLPIPSEMTGKTLY